MEGKLVKCIDKVNRELLTAQAPAAVATRPPDIIIGLRPRVLLNSMPLKAPAVMLLRASCLPREYPIVELTPLYTMAITPAEFPRKGPLLVIAFRAEFSRSRGDAVGCSITC